MEPSGPTAGPPPALLNRLQPVAPQLQVGQQLQATVLENSAGKILLSLGNRQVSAESSLPFQAGQVLTLQVRSVGEQPVLKVIAALQESATATAVRMLLPRYGPTTPLLASLSQLAATPEAPLPPAVRELVNALVRNLPDAATLSTPAAVRNAASLSGSFLEHHLTLAADTETPVPVRFDTDFKANLLRLLQLVRDWPGAAGTASTPAGRGPEAGPPGPGPATPALPSAPTLAPELAGTRPATPSASTATPPAVTTAAGGVSPQQPAAGDPRTLQRAIETAASPSPPRTAAAPGATTPPGAGGLGPPLSNAPVPATTTPMPPFAGVVPAPQASVQATIDLLNRFGHLRLDLLQQTEAALARIHLNQLASLPREAEHRLVEWLFDIPARRGDTIDLWSARVHRDSDGKPDKRERPDTQWRVQLAFDLPGLGPMQAQINLQGERVSTQFWATQADTLPLLREHLHELRRSMRAAGLEVGDIDCRQGAIPVTPTRPPNPLINETV